MYGIFLLTKVPRHVTLPPVHPNCKSQCISLIPCLFNYRIALSDHATFSQVFYAATSFYGGFTLFFYIGHALQQQQVETMKAKDLTVTQEVC